jgi:hypothetical protein
MRQSPHQK